MRLDMVAYSDEASPSKVFYLTAIERLEPHQPTDLIARIREDWLDFYRTRGFTETERMWESRLELADFTPERLGSVARASAAGITIKTLADLPDDEMTQRLLYRTITELLGDVPFSEPLNIWLLEVWQERFWRFMDPTSSGSANCARGRVLTPDWLGTGLTGAKRAYGGRGVAFALKLCAAYAKEVGVEVISIRNRTGNRAMLAINEALGFVKEPAWVRLKKTL